MDTGSIRLAYREDGLAGGRTVVFLNSLGTDLRLWDQVVGRLPESLRILRCDMRGHGLSACPPGPYPMGALIKDVEHLLDFLSVRDAAIVGLSIGGMIAQGLASKRPDLCRAIVLSNTGAKIGTRQMWENRMEAVLTHGIAALSDEILERWFSETFRQSPDLEIWRNMLERQPAQGYAACCAAIAGTDFMTTTAELTLPALSIAGSEDGATPSDLVRETAGLLDDSRFYLIRGAGHLPCVENPDEYADVLVNFLREIAHV